MDKSIVQVNLQNMGVSYKGYALLDYLIGRIFVDFKSADLQKERCLFFSSSSDVKESLDELSKCGLIKSYEWDRGSVSLIKPNRELIVQTLLPPETQKIVIKKAAAATKRVKTEISDNVITIVKHYNGLGVFRGQSATKTVDNFANAALEKYTLDQIIEAIDFASTQQWVLNKVDQPWFNLAWILKNIDGFMLGGKYNKYGDNSEEKVENKYIKDSDSSTFFL